MKRRAFLHPPAFWYPPEDGVAPLAARLLRPLSRLPTALARRRRRRIRPRGAGVPVVCVGNVVLGGAGKTPLALALGEHFLHRGRNPHFLSRGYGGSARGPLQVEPSRHDAALVGDEALELAGLAPCWVSRHRLRGAQAAREAGADMVILDDGLQDATLRHDLALLVVDGGRGLGNGHVLPAGPLREPWEDALARCDLVVVMGEARRPRLRAALAQCDPAMLFAARLRPRRMSLAPRLLAFSGIGYGEKLLASLSELGGNVVAHRAFPDHHRFTPAEAAKLLHEARLLDARPVTTRKDALRLAGAPADSPCGRLRRALSVVRVEAHIEEMERFALCAETLLAARARKDPRR